MQEHNQFPVVFGDGRLPSWNDSHTRRAITEFVAWVTAQDSPTFVPPAERIVLLAHDGVLCCEHPVRLQDAFAISQVELLAPRSPQLLNVLMAVSAGASAGEPAPLDAIRAAHGDLNAQQFSALVSHWFATAEHPFLKRPFAQLVYLPMLELLEYLRQNAFQVWLLCRGEEEFLRALATDAYGVAAGSVVGSARRDSWPRESAAALITIASRSDAELFGTQARRERSLRLLVLHDDAEREFGYHDLPLGTPAAAGDVLISMRQDWKVVFSPVELDHCLPANSAWRSKTQAGQTRSVSSATTNLRNISVRVA